MPHRLCQWNIRVLLIAPVFQFILLETSLDQIAGEINASYDAVFIWLYFVDVFICFLTRC